MARPGNFNERPLTRQNSVMTLAAKMIRYITLTSGETLSTACHFSGSQLVDQPNTTAEYSKMSMGFI